MRRHLLVNRAGTLLDYPARSLPRYSTRELATTQLPTLALLLTPNFVSFCWLSCIRDIAL